MDTGMITDVMRDAVGVVIKLGGPMLVLSGDPDSRADHRLYLKGGHYCGRPSAGGRLDADDASGVRPGGL